MSAAPDGEHSTGRETIGRAVFALDDARDRVQEAERNLVETIRRADIDPADVDLLDYLYWQCPEVSTQIICAGFRMTSAALRGRVTPRRVEVECACGDVFLVEVSSRSSLADTNRSRLSCLACLPEGVTPWVLARFKRFPGRRDLSRLVELRAMPYRDYLRTPEWFSTRAAALDRAGWACQVCSGKYALEVHHRTYDRMGSEQPRDLTVLCADCHDSFHREGRLRR